MFYSRPEEFGSRTEAIIDQRLLSKCEVYRSSARMQEENGNAVRSQHDVSWVKDSDNEVNFEPS